MSDSQYELLHKIRTLSAVVVVLMYLFLQTSTSTNVDKGQMFDLHKNPYNIADTIPEQTAPREYNPRSGKVFLAKNQKGPSL